MLKYHTIDTPTTSIATFDNNNININNYNNNNNNNYSYNYINIINNNNNNINNNNVQENQLTHIETAKQRKATRKNNAIDNETNVRPKRKSRTLLIISA
ncbi:putative uncharacterized protein DDB_G0288037 isoform X2 [Drosophila innubila]|nr:putative uncharacterized protein DDB_G0288037 isoform X2 [Drosophila innubila]